MAGRYLFVVGTEEGRNLGHLIAGFGLADRPPSAYQRRVYLDLNARVFYLDTGAGWEPIGSSEAAASILTKLLTVDGPGSALDADLLDGLHAAAFIRNLGNVASFRGGLLADRPASGAVGEYYFSTDFGRLSEGTGAGWATRAVSRFDDLIQKNHKAQHEPGGADALTGLTDASIAAGAAIAEAKLALASDAAAATASRRTLGAGAQQAAAGNDGRLSDARTPTPHAFFSDRHSDVDITDVRADGDVVVWRPALGKYLHETPGVASVGDASPTAKGVSLLNEAATDPANPRVVVQNSSLLATHHEGLAVELGGANALSIQPGSAWIPGLSRVLNVPSTISKSALTLTANTWYYAYLFDNAGTPDVEVSTVAPAAPYKGTARIKGGATPDNTRRYLGAARTNGVAAFFNFLRQGRLVKYRENTTGTPFRVLAGGVATASTGVSLAALVPPTSRVGSVKLQNTGSDRSPSFGTPDGMGGIVATVFALAPGNELSEPFPLGASQELFYSYAVAPTSGGAFVDVIGYHEEV